MPLRTIYCLVNDETENERNFENPAFLNGKQLVNYKCLPATSCAIAFKNVEQVLNTGKENERKSEKTDDASCINGVCFGSVSNFFLIIGC